MARGALHVISTLDPAFGGPVSALTNLVPVLRKICFDPVIATCDAPGAAWLKNVPAEIHALGPGVGKFGSAAYDYTPRLVPFLREHAHRFKSVVVHGIWQYHSFACWRALVPAGVPYFVFPHGALSPYFKRHFPLKHMKKWLYWPWADYRVLRDARGVLFTCAEEREQAAQSFWLYRVNPIVVSYGIRPPPDDPERSRREFLERFPGLRGKRIVLCLARIQPVKAHDALIDAFARNCRADEALHLVIAGGGDSGLEQRLRRQAAALGLEGRISWLGQVGADLKWGALRAAEVTALASHTENFGVAIVEGFACGVPTVISRGVNLWREVESAGAGIVGDIGADGMAGALGRWLALSGAERSAMGLSALRAFEANFNIERTAIRLCELFNNPDLVPG